MSIFLYTQVNDHPDSVHVWSSHVFPRQFWQPIQHNVIKILIISWCYRPMRSKTYHSTAAFTSIRRKTEVNDHPVSMGVTYDHNDDPLAVLIFLSINK